MITDGVYFVQDGFSLIRFEDSTCVYSKKNCDVMVSYHGHGWIVCKDELAGGFLPLLSEDKYPENESPFYKSEINALNDFDMKSCTEHLRKTGLAFDLGKDLYIPTAGQLAAMYLYRGELNEALWITGGTRLANLEYWSSSENSKWSNWAINLASGNICGWNKHSRDHIRPCMIYDKELPENANPESNKNQGVEIGYAKQILQEIQNLRKEVSDLKNNKSS